MQLKVIQDTNDIVVIPTAFKNEEKPPKFIFRSPNSQDCLKFMWGGNNVFEAVCDCFKEFENKIELIGSDNKPIEYNNYREFVNVGLSGEIAVIHNECMNAVANRLNDMINEAKKTEKKLQSLTNSTKKAEVTQNT